MLGIKYLNPVILGYTASDYVTLFCCLSEPEITDTYFLLFDSCYPVLCSPKLFRTLSFYKTKCFV